MVIFEKLPFTHGFEETVTLPVFIVIVVICISRCIVLWFCVFKTSIP